MKFKHTKIIILLICFTILYSHTSLFVHAEEMDLNAKSAILMDAATGKVLYEKNVHEKLPPASVTKIMTMLLAMEAIDKNIISVNDQVTISERASEMGGSQLYLEPGEEKTVQQLLKGIAVASANDACVALAEHIGGTEELFIKKMNNKAKELGMKDTHFMNTNGLPQEGHYTSAYDISLMSRELLKYPKIHEWLTIWMSNMKVGLPNKKITNLQLTNTNKLIKTYPGANGIKTGYTSEAKYCLSASATREGLTLISVILGSPTSAIRFGEAKKLLDFGFSTYRAMPITRKNQMIDELLVEKGKEKQINVVAKDHLSVLVKKGEEAKVQKEIILPKSIKAPVHTHQKVGKIIIKKNGQEIESVDIVTEKAVEAASFTSIFHKLIIKAIQ